MMHGNNEVRKQELRDDGWLQVASVFSTLQGEGPRVGQPATFVRLSGCNLRCWFCDTKWDDKLDPVCSPVALTHRIMQITPSGVHLVVITGGEPLRQNIIPLIKHLSSVRPFDDRLIVQIETAGTLWLDGLEYEPAVEIIVSPKTPIIHPAIRRYARAFKYVTRARDYDHSDGLPYQDTQNVRGKRNLAKPRVNAPVFLSPMDEGNDALNRENMKTTAQLAMQFGHRAGCQLHKVLDIP